MQWLAAECLAMESISRHFKSLAWLPVGLAIFVLSGCAGSSSVLQGQVQKSQQQQVALTRQNEQLQGRANTLGSDNQELSALLAQSRQRTKVVEEQLSAVREQLTSTATQLAKTRQEKDASDKQVNTMQASMKRSGSVTIQPNSSYQKPLVAISVPGVDIRKDEDVLRIVLPASRVFEPHTVRLRPGADQLITSVAAEIARNYPNNRIGIEGHTDSAPVVNQQWRNNHEFSAGRAVAVYNVLVQQARMNPTQLFVAAHGSNHPAYSNAPLGGKERNRRVEIVVYPEKVTQ